MADVGQYESEAATRENYPRRGTTQGLFEAELRFRFGAIGQLQGKLSAGPSPTLLGLPEGNQ